MQPYYTESQINQALKERLRHIESKIHLSEDSTKENVELLKKVMDNLIQGMKMEDRLFTSLYWEPFYTGSYFDGMKIDEAVEFDINLVLRMPLKIEHLKILRDDRRRGFCRISIRDDVYSYYRNERLICEGQFIHKFFVTRPGSDPYLSLNAVRAWMQRVVDKALKNVLFKLQKLFTDVSKIIHSSSGPARTLILVRDDDKSDISVDLVPVFRFEWKDATPPGINPHPSVFGFAPRIEDRFWFIVPKECSKKMVEENVTSYETDTWWRIHFPKVERNVLHDKGCVKPVIKLLKHFRDTARWDKLASYYLKTLVMLTFLDNPDTKEYWHDKNLGKRFLEMLERLRNALMTQRNFTYFPDGLEYTISYRGIPYLFDMGLDLLAGLHEDTKENYSGNISRLIRKIKQEPSSIVAEMDQPPEEEEDEKAQCAIL